MVGKLRLPRKHTAKLANGVGAMKRGITDQEGNHAMTATVKEWAVLGLIAFVLGQALIYHHAAPFAVIFIALIWQERRRGFAPAVLGGMLGTVLSAGFLPAVVLLLWSLLVPLPWRLQRGWLKWPLVGIGAAGLFAVGQSPNLYVGLWVLLVLAGTLLLYGLVARELVGLEQGHGNRSTLILALAAVGCFIAGLAGFSVGWLTPSLVVGGLVMLIASVVMGPAGGAVAGATLGATLAIRGTDPMGGVGILVAGGFFAGWLGTRAWRLTSLGLFGGVVLYAVLIRLPSQLTAFWISLAVAAAIVQAFPDGVMDVIRKWAEALVTGEHPDTLPERLQRIAGVMLEMARAFRIEEETAPGDANLMQLVVAGVCTKCSLYRACWEDEFYRSYRGLIDLTTKAETALVTQHDLTGDLARRCIRPESLAQATNVAMQRERERVSLARRIQESRQLAELQLTGLSQLVEDMAGDFERREMRPLPPRRRRESLTYRVGLAKRPRQGGLVSGDSDLVREISRERVVFGLSDGMGVGPRAAWESGTAMSLLEQLLMAGFSQSLAVKAVNTTLLLRSVDDHFATLDLVLFDRQNRGLELVKVAAAPTFLRRQGRVEVIQSQSLPVGILRDVQIEPLYHTAEPGDFLVLVTDGVLENEQERGDEKLRQFLEKLTMTDPTLIAETILSFMLGDSQEGRDDASVMVILIADEAMVKHPLRYEGPVREWQRITPTPIRTRAR